jgi:hypothetical protein
MHQVQQNGAPHRVFELIGNESFKIQKNWSFLNFSLKKKWVVMQLLNKSEY